MTILKSGLKSFKSLELEGKEDSYPFQLSGGQQVGGNSKSLHAQPSVLCFDEPTSALDEETSSNIKNNQVFGFGRNLQ